MISDFEHVDPDVITLGTINFKNILAEREIASNNRFKGRYIGECKVQVYGNEGQIPHFHIESLDKKFDCCVRIYEPYFFQHGTHQDLLNGYQCKQLDKWLKNIEKFSNTNWQNIVLTWIGMNPDCKYPENQKVNNQPNYSNMNSILL